MNNKTITLLKKLGTYTGLWRHTLIEDIVIKDNKIFFKSAFCDLQDALRYISDYKIDFLKYSFFEINLKNNNFKIKSKYSFFEDKREKTDIDILKLVLHHIDVETKYAINTIKNYLTEAKKELKELNTCFKHNKNVLASYDLDKITDKIHYKRAEIRFFKDILHEEKFALNQLINFKKEVRTCLN